jgi:hypothetical protein
VDDKGNSGEFRGGGLTLIERTPTTGYKAIMPSGGSGPFTIQVCYGEDARTCCEAQVDFPSCSISGPTEMEPGAEGSFIPSLGMVGAAVSVTGDLQFVRNMAYDVGFVAKMKDGACNGGTVTVTYGGRVCGSINVDSTLKRFVGVVTGPTRLEPGEMAYFAHNLGPGATYNGTLVMGMADDGGAVLVMPDSAEDGETRTASWAGTACGQVASMTVSTVDLMHCSFWGYTEGCGKAVPGMIIGNGTSDELPCMVVSASIPITQMRLYSGLCGNGPFWRQYTGPIYGRALLNFEQSKDIDGNYTGVCREISRYDLEYVEE